MRSWVGDDDAHSYSDSEDDGSGNDTGFDVNRV